MKPGLSRFSFMGDAEGPGSEVLLYSSAERRLSAHLVADGGDELLRTSIFDYLSGATSRGLAAARGPPLPLPRRVCRLSRLRTEAGMRRSRAAPFAVPGRRDDLCRPFRGLRPCGGRDLGGRTHAGATRRLPADWLDATLARLRTVGPPPVPAGSSNDTIEFRLRDDRDTYLENIQRALDEIRAGESYEVCLTTQIEAEVELKGLSLYSVLRRTNPAPFASYLRIGGVEVISASPERFISVDKAGRVEAKPIKGTAPRGRHGG